MCYTLSRSLKKVIEFAIVASAAYIVIGAAQDQSFPWNVSSNGKNDDINLCGRRYPTRVPVYSNNANSTVTIPCWSYHHLFSPAQLSLYKGSSEKGRWEDVSDRALDYIYDVGIVYNVSGDVPVDRNSTYLGKYACHIENSSSYAITQLYMDDYFVNVSVSPTPESCDAEYIVNYRMHTFWCEVLEELYENNFEWFFRTTTGKEEILNESFGNRASYKYGAFIGQHIEFKFPRSNISGVGCRVRKKFVAGDASPSKKQTSSESISVFVRDARKPFIYNASEIEWHTDEAGLSLTCNYEVEPPTTPVEWYKDGVKMTSFHHKSSTAFRVKNSTIYNLGATRNMTNYTCLVQNEAGIASKTFLISRDSPKGRTITSTTSSTLVADSSHAFKHPAVIVAVVVVLICVALSLLTVYVLRWKKEQEERRQREDKEKIKSLLERDPVISSELEILFHTCTKIAEGHYGEVYSGQFVSAEGSSKSAILKMCKWPMALSARQAHLLCQDFLQEIEILQWLQSPLGESHPNIVRYLGFAAPNRHNYRVYMALEPCVPGDMGHFLRGCARSRIFFNDTESGEYRHYERIREERRIDRALLGTSHLMKWAEQLAGAMAFIADKNIIHRDLAARNMLLAGSPPFKFDELKAKVSDFGMARKCDSYVVPVDNSVAGATEGKPRSIPARRYAPEALGPGAEYTTKSDVWSFAILLWEMFSFAQTEPFSDVDLGPNSQVQRNLKTLLEDGTILEWNDLIPDQIWELMERCWEVDPNLRPSFADLAQELEDINRNEYSLYQVYPAEEEPVILANHYPNSLVNPAEGRADANGGIPMQMLGPYVQVGVEGEMSV